MVRFMYSSQLISDRGSVPDDGAFPRTLFFVCCLSPVSLDPHPPAGSFCPMPRNPCLAWSWLGPVAWYPDVFSSAPLPVAADPGCTCERFGRFDFSSRWGRFSHYDRWTASNSESADETDQHENRNDFYPFSHDFSSLIWIRPFPCCFILYRVVKNI